MTGLTRYHLLLILPPLFWAGNALVGRAVAGDISPLALSFWRWSLALALILPFTWRQVLSARAELAANWPHVLGLALFSVAAYNTLLYLALQTTGAINATLVSTSMPVMILLLSRLWLGERVGLGQGLGVVVALCGVLAVVARGDAAVLASLSIQQGDGLMLLATLSWSVYSVMLRRKVLAVPGLALLAVLIALGTAMIFPFFLWDVARHGLPQPSLSIGLAIVYTAIFPSIMAYYFWNKGVGAVGAGVAGLYTYLLPLFTAILAVSLLDEAFRWYHGAGAALIVGGITLATRRRK